MDGRDLDVTVIPSPVRPFVLDAHIGEMHLVIEVRQIVIMRPLFDLGRVPIRAPIGVVTVVIPLVQPPLVLTLELVIENHAIDPCATLREVFGFMQIGAIDLAVVFHFARLFEFGVERLTMLVAMVLAMVMGVVTAVRFENVPALLGEHDGHVPMAIQALRSDKPFLPQVSQITRSRIGGAAVVIAEVARRHDPKRADGRERAAFRSPQRVLAVAGIVNDLAVRSARQIEVAHKHVARIEAVVSIARLAITIEPS
jgi:hypothetical protein